MATRSIEVPDDTREFLEQQTRKGGYSTVDDYLRALLNAAQRRAAQDDLEQKLLDGINSGPASEMTSEDWALVRRAFTCEAPLPIFGSVPFPGSRTC